MSFKPVVIGLPLLAGLAFAVSACERPETEVETPNGDTEIEQPAESPIQTPAAPSPTTPTSPAPAAP
jgi:hypothetical protein